MKASATRVEMRCATQFGQEMLTTLLVLHTRAVGDRAMSADFDRRLRLGLMLFLVFAGCSTADKDAANFNQARPGALESSTAGLLRHEPAGRLPQRQRDNAQGEERSQRHGLSYRTKIPPAARILRNG
jgi:hypothetical protein